MAGAFEDTVATKADLDKLESSVKTDMTSLRAEFKAEITEVKSELKQDIAGVKGDIKLLKWMIGVVLACVAFPLLKSFLVWSCSGLCRLPPSQILPGVVVLLLLAGLQDL